MEAERPPKFEPYRKGEIPSGYRRKYTSYRLLWALGLAAFASTYSLSIVTGALGRSSGIDGTIYVPLVGPFIAAAKCESCTSKGTTLMSVLGVGQVVGAALIIGGLATRQKRLVRIKRHALQMGPTWIAYGVPGLGLSGVF